MERIMPRMYRVVAAIGLLALTSPASAADLAQSAMAGDPTWPAVEAVAPSMALTQQPAEPMPGSEPTQPVTGATAAGIALRQAPLSDDPLQGHAVLPGGVQSKGSEPRLVACQGSCACAG